MPHPTPVPTFTEYPESTAEGKPLYVPGSQAERQARQTRMSSPLRRGTHESWWTRDMGFFNAVSKTIPTYRVLDEEGNPVKGAQVPELEKDEALAM